MALTEEQRISFANHTEERESKEITEMLGEIAKKFDWQAERNKELREENRKLKENVWKDEEMARLKEENETLRDEWSRGFGITKEEYEKIREFLSQFRNKDRKIDNIGSNVTYSFTPTGIGILGEVSIKVSGGEVKTFTFRGPEQW